MDMMVYQTGFGMLPKAVMQSPNLKIESKAIFAYLTTFAGNGDTAFPGRELICKDLGISKDRFYKYMNELKEKGYIKIEQVKDDNGKFRHNIYKLIPFPEIPDTVNPDTEIPDTGNKDTKNNNNKNNNNKNKPAKKKQVHGEFGNVKLYDNELEILISNYGKPIIDEYIDRLDYYIAEKGAKYKSHYLTIKRWLKNANIEPNKSIDQKEGDNTFDEEYFKNLLNKGDKF